MITIGVNRMAELWYARSQVQVRTMTDTSSTIFECLGCPSTKGTLLGFVYHTYKSMYKLRKKMIIDILRWQSPFSLVPLRCQNILDMIGVMFHQQESLLKNSIEAYEVSSCHHKRAGNFAFISVLTDHSIDQESFVCFAVKNQVW